MPHTATPSATHALAELTALPLPDDQIDCFNRQGFCVQRGLFSRAEVETMAQLDVARLASRETELKHHLELGRNADGTRNVHKLEGVCRVLPDMRAWCDHPRMRSQLRQLMGDEPVLFKDKFILKAPGGGDAFGAHQDMGYGFHRFATKVISCMIAVDPATDENGCLQVAPVTFTPSLVQRPEEPLDPRLIPESAWLPVPLEPGDVVYFDGLTPHRSFPNRTTGSRRVYIITFNAADDGDQYDAYYDWYFEWRKDEAAGGQRNDYVGSKLRRSLPKLSTFVRSIR